MARTPVFEWEDLVASWEPGELLAPPPGPLARTDRLGRWSQRALGYAPALERRLAATPGEASYELLAVLCRSPDDLLRLGPLAPLRARCRRAVCWFSELWASSLPRRRLEPLRLFDAVGLSYEGTVEPLRARLPGVRVEFVPPAVDTLAFRRDPALARPIDVVYMGRRDPDLHAQLRAWSAAGDRFYVYTTASPGPVWLPAREHRDLLAAQIGRARYFLAHPAKFNATDQTHGQQELGYRYTEGLAGGAVVLGHVPPAPSIQALFDWEDSVIPLPPGTAPDGVRALLTRLDRDPERVARIGARNAEQARRRHDWAHRWLTLLDLVGLEPTAALRERLATLSAPAGQ